LAEVKSADDQVDDGDGCDDHDDKSSSLSSSQAHLELQHLRDTVAVLESNDEEKYVMHASDPCSMNNQLVLLLTV